MNDLGKQSLALHKKHGGKLEIKSKIPLRNRRDLSLAYTPGVADVCQKIFQDKSLAKIYTIKKNTVAVVTDGSAVLGLGNLGPLAALPVMEGKCVLFKRLAGVDACPHLPRHAGYRSRYQHHQKYHAGVWRHKLGGYFGAALF